MAAKKAAGSYKITLHDHIKELRNRLFGVAIIFLVVSAVAYNYKDILIAYLLKPLGNEKLIYLNPAGGFSFIFQVTMYAGIAAAVPFLVYHLYKFVAPALPQQAQRHSVLVMISSLVLLCIGVAFGYFVAIPGALTFLNNFANGYVIPSLTADSYLNFILAYTAGLGILFQLPLVLLLIHWIRPLKPGGLLRFERYMILIAFVAAAVITPTPDIVNQLVIALPIILMYQAGVIAVCVSVLRAKRRARMPKLAHAGRFDDAKTRKDPNLPVSGPFGPLAGSETSGFAAGVSAPVAQVATSVQPAASVLRPAASGQSFARRSMDIMIAAPIRQRGSVSRPPRTVQHRTPPLKVPARSPLPSGRIPSIDGISILY